MLQEIKDFVSIFFDKLGININNIDIVSQADDVYFLKIDTPDSWILIWNHGSIFEALQWLFRKIFRGKFWENIRVHLEINDYIHDRDAKLFSFIDKEINKAKDTWRNMKLPLLNWYERKKIHSYISDINDPEIMTESRWEWRDRRLFIILAKNKVNRINKNIKYQNDTKDSNSKLEIDIDWDDI